MGWRRPGSRETLSGSSLKPAAASAALSASKEVAPQPRLRTCGVQMGGCCAIRSAEVAHLGTVVGVALVQHAQPRLRTCGVHVGGSGQGWVWCSRHARPRCGAACTWVGVEHHTRWVRGIFPRHYCSDYTQLLYYCTTLRFYSSTPVPL